MRRLALLKSPLFTDGNDFITPVCQRSHDVGKLAREVLMDEEVTGQRISVGRRLPWCSNSQLTTKSVEVIAGFPVRVANCMDAVDPLPSGS